MGQSEKVDVIIPVYNSEKYLKKCIESVLNQSFKDFVLILVNDASSDNSKQICEYYKIKDNRVRVINHEINRGLSESRLDGVNYGNAEWICFIDNDDSVSPYLIEEMYNNASYSEEIDMVVVSGQNIRSTELDDFVWSNKQNDNLMKKLIYKKDACAFFCKDHSGYGIISCMWGKLFKRTTFVKVLKEVLLYKSKLGWVYLEDVFYIPIFSLMLNKMVFINEIMYLHRQSAESLSSDLIPHRFHYEALDACGIVSEYLNQYSTEDIKSEYFVDYMLLLQSTWYKTYRYERNRKIRKLQLDKMNEVIREYTVSVSKMHATDDDLNSKLKIVSIKLFFMNRYIWMNTIGFFHFEIMGRVKR